VKLDRPPCEEQEADLHSLQMVFVSVETSLPPYGFRPQCPPCRNVRCRRARNWALLIAQCMYQV